MRLPGAKTSLYTVAFVLFLLIFAYLLLNYTRRVDGESMWPTLESGDLVVIQPSPISDVHIGDIIVYGPPCSVEGSSVIHRVVNGTAEGGFITQGDDRRTNPGTDQKSDIANRPITQACLIGKVVFIIPYVERLASLPDGLNYIIAALLFLAIIVTELGGRRVPQESGEGEKAVESASSFGSRNPQDYL